MDSQKAVTPADSEPIFSSHNALHATPRAYKMTTGASTYEIVVDTVSRKTQAFAAGGTLLVLSSADVWCRAGVNPTAVAPTTPGAAGDQTGTGAGDMLIPADNQIPVQIAAGEKLAFITKSGTATITYTLLEV